MRRANVRVQLRQSRRHTLAQMRMTHVEAHANISKMTRCKNLYKMVGPRHVALQILHQQLHAQGTRKGAQMFERANGMLQSPRTPGVFAFSQMKDEIPERDLLGNLERPLDLIHRIDATALLRMNHVHRRRPAPPHLRIGIKRCVHRERLGRIRPEPFREFADVRPTGVIEVLPRGKQLHALCSGAGKNVQQARMQPVIEKNVRRNGL